MKNFKKLTLNFALLLVVAISSLSLALVGCTIKKDSKGKNIEIAMNATIEVIRDNNTKVSALELVDSNENIDVNPYIEYMSAVAGSSNFVYESLPFDATISASMDSVTQTIFARHYYKIDGNNIEIKAIFTYQDSIEGGDYEHFVINYDFATKTLISFEWTTCLFSSDNPTVYYHEYKDNKLKTLNINNEDEQYTTIKTQAVTDANDFYNTKEVSSKTYNFSKEYVEIYNKFNPDNPLTVA